MAEPAPLVRPARYEDLLAVPDHLVAEIVDGALITSPRPASAHAHASSVIGMDVGGPFHGSTGRPAGPGGWWILFEPELHLGPDILVPDLAGWRRARLPFLEDIPAFTLTPDWVCEVASPKTAQLDRVKKMVIYARAAVGHLWLVDPLARTLEIYRLEGGHWIVASTHGGDERIHAEPFAAVELEMARWWLPRAPDFSPSP